MNYSKTLKPNLVGAPYKRKECNSFYYALILIGLLLKRANNRVTNGVMTQQEVNAHLTINANASCRMKNEICYYVKCKIFLQMKMQSFLYENLTNTFPSKPSASTMKNEKCNDAS